MRGTHLTELQIDSLVSGNLRINGKVYSIDDALATFPNNRKQIQYSAERALYYHSMAKEQIGISWVDTVLSNL
jgi:hypothetical protein